MLSGNNKVKDDVLNESLDERVAPSLGLAVIGKEHKMYSDPEEFFKRTLITESMAGVLENVANVVSEGKGNTINVLSAFFGGGKTHTLLVLYHAIRNPEALNLIIEMETEPKSVKERLKEIVKKLKSTDVIVIDGSTSELAPSPLRPIVRETYQVITLWGYIADALGSYDDFKKLDKALLPPKTDDIVSLLSNRKLVIIIDEIAQYVQTLYNAVNEDLKIEYSKNVVKFNPKEYSKNVVSFFENLVKAVATLTNVALVISLPVRRVGNEEELESNYESEIVRSLNKAIHRVSATYLEPVMPKDIPALLRIRLFDKVDYGRAKEVMEILRRDYDRDKEIFGEEAEKVTERVKETYPFHPLYIDTLLDILDKHRGLQKTRDLLRISRMVVRAVVNDKDDTYDLILPWHIDVERDHVKDLLLKSGYEAFRLPLEEDIVKRCNNYEKPWIAKIVAKVLFIKTFVYGGAFVPKAEFYPSPAELALLTYEPGLFNSRRALPKDIADAIDWLTSSLLYVVKDEKTQRLWFTYLKSPVKFIEDAAQRFKDAEAYKKILDVTEELLKEPPESRTKRGRMTEEIKVFDAEESKVSKECRPIDHDARKYIVYACLNLDITKKEEVLKEIIYRTANGGTRRYVNTVYVVYPKQKENLPIEYAKKILACEEAKREGWLESLVNEVKGVSQGLEDVKRIYEDKIDSYCERVANNFYPSVISALSKLAYPVQKDAEGTIEEIDMANKTSSIIFSVEQTLFREGLKKVMSDLDFDTLEYYLRDIGVDIKSSARKVSDIIDYFYSNPRLPAVSERTIKEAIAEGIRKLEIGLRCNNKVYYKRIMSCEAEEQCLNAKVEGEPITGKEVADDCEVLPYKEALMSQMSGLERREREEGEAKIVEDYYVIYENKFVSIKDVVTSLDRYNSDTLNALREAPLVKLSKKIIIDVEPSEHELNVRPGKEVKHVLVIKRSGPFSGRLHTKADYGEVNPANFNVDESFTESPVIWTIKAPTEPGNYNYVLQLLTEDDRRVASAKLIVVVEPEGFGRELYEGVPPVGTQIELMRVIIEGKDLKPIGLLKNKLEASVVVKDVKLELSAETVQNKKSNVSLEMDDVSLDDALAILIRVFERFGLAKVTTKISLEISPNKDKSFKMPALTEEEQKVLSQHKIIYKPMT